MNQWDYISLGDVCDIVAGGTPSRRNPKYFGGDIPWVKISDMLQGIITHTDETITKASIEDSAAKILPAGTVLLSIFATIGRTAILGIDAATNQAIVGVIPKAKVKLNTSYLRYCLDDSIRELTKQARGVAQININSTILKSLKIPFPPLAEQERIVHLLDEAESLRKLRCQVSSRMDVFISALFDEMFGDPETNAKGWQVVPITELAEKFSDGPFGSNLKTSHYTEDGIRILRLQNIGIGEFIDDNKAFISNAHFQSLRKHECVAGDVIVGTLGDPNLRACLLPQFIPIAVNKADCVQIRPNLKNAEAEYICWLLNMPSTLRMASGLIQGQTRARISMGRLRELRVPLPPLIIQREFAQRVQAARALQSAQARSEERIEALYQSMLSRAFAGEL
jgi:type I restriction enzyme S subunit